MSSKEKRPALISDFDNTLFFRNTEERFKAQDIFEILFFQKRGGIFGICTGRYRFKDCARVVVHADGRVYALCKAEYKLQVQIYSCSELPADRIYGVSMRLPDENAAAEAARLIEEEYGDKVSAFQNLVNVDIVAAGCSKGTGAARVRELFPIGRMGGIGDSYNDLPLIEAADVGFTFPTAPEPLRDASDHIVLSVSQAIEKMG